jgi:hypothetical protein
MLVASNPAILGEAIPDGFIRSSPSWWIQPRCIGSEKTRLQSFFPARD